MVGEKSFVRNVPDNLIGYLHSVVKLDGVPTLITDRRPNKLITYLFSQRGDKQLMSYVYRIELLWLMINPLCSLFCWLTSSFLH